MDKKNDFDLVNQSWESSKDDLFGGNSSLGSEPFSISSPLDSMASSLGGLDDNRDILGSGSSLSGLDLHHGMDDVLGSSVGSPFESAQPDNKQSSLLGSDIFKDLHSQKDDQGALGASDQFKSIFASDSSSLDLSHSLDHSLSKSDTGISFGTLGSDLLGDYGSRDYQSEFLSSGLSQDTLKAGKELSSSVIDDSKKDIPNRTDDALSNHDISTYTLSDDVRLQEVRRENDNSLEAFSEKKTAASEPELDSEPEPEPEPTYKELKCVPVSENVSSTDALKLYSDQVDAYNNASLELNWYEDDSNTNQDYYNIDNDYSIDSYKKSLRKEVDNYDYDYTGLQLSDVGPVAEEIEKYQSRENIGCGIIAVCVISFLFSGIWLGFALLGIVGVVGGSIYTWHCNSKAKNLYKTHFVEETLKKNIYLKMYQPNEVYGKDLHSLNLTNENWNRSKVDDVITGLYKGVSFTFEDIALYYNSGGKNSTTRKIFRGQVYETSLKFAVPSIRYVRRDEPADENGILRDYMRYGNLDKSVIDLIETPQFVEELNKFGKEHACLISEIRLLGKRMIIVVNSMSEWFELTGKLEDSIELLNAQMIEMLGVLQFMKNCGIVNDKHRAE